MKLEICKSHERQSNPQAWEPLMTGTPEEIARYYDGLSQADRVTDGYRVIDDAGDAMHMQEFMFAFAK